VLEKHQNKKDSTSNIQNDLIQVLVKEAESINYLIQNFPIQATQLVEHILNTKGRVVFCGMGKSGLVGKKLVATFSSIGTSSLFLHPAEALHGDLGMVMPQDFFVAISKSGSGKELEQIIPLLKSRGNVTSLISCANGSLCNLVDLSVVLPFTQEACEMNLAPTSSSTLTMAFGDALAVVVSKLKGFGKNDFAKFHPAGALGKRLLLSVRAIMYAQASLPLINADTNFNDLLFTITSKKLGVAIVVDGNKKLLGIVTDGDLRRACEKGPEIFEYVAADIMTKNPKTIDVNLLAYDALQIMENFNITSLVVTDNEAVVGLVHIHDLVKAGI
jgi:arabinose-5-phosphate isomerase